MPAIMDMISTRLTQRELVSVEIDRLIKDVSNVLGTKRRFESVALRKSLIHLGWEESVVDYRTLELIFMFLENAEELDGYGPAGP